MRPSASSRPFTTTTPSSSRRTGASRINWSLISSYRWSRLTGNFEGFFRNDNGQSDPGISSLYDYPTNDPTYTAIGATQFGYAGDIRFLGTAGNGPLPLDRTHDVKVYGSYAFGMGLNLSLGLELESGAPLTALAAHPVYDDRRRDSADAARRGLPDLGWLPDAHAVDEAGQRGGVVQR